MANQLLLNSYTSSSASLPSFWLGPEEIPEKFDDKVKMLGELLNASEFNPYFKDEYYK
jgi:hypothetical protein